MCNKILNNLEWYRRIPASIVKRYNDDFYAIIDTAYSNAIITKALWEFIRNNFPRTPVFYALPKVHKNTINPPGRPIISSVGAISENASKLVDEVLKPFVSFLPSFVRDTLHFLQIIDKLKNPEHALLVTIDVESLYSSIPHEKGVAAIKHTLGQLKMWILLMENLLLLC